MPPENNNAKLISRLIFIDGLRGLAVAMVVCFHAAVWAGLPLDGMGKHYLFEGLIPIELGRLRHVLSVGGAGVDLFLAISGFCLFWPLVKNGQLQAPKLDVASYLKRRIRRIVPPYYFGLACVLLCSYWTYHFQGPSWWPWAPASFQNAFPWQGDDAILNMTSHLLLIHGFFNAYINSYEGAYWSLSLEWQFYFLFIPLALVARRVGVLWAALVPIVVTILFRIVCLAFFPEFLSTAVGHLFSLSRWAEFGAGMLAAAVVSGSLPPRVIAAFKPLASLRLLYLIASICYAVYLEYAQISRHILPFAWGNASLALLVAGAQSRGFLQKLFAWRPLVWLGTISYSLYLTHGVVYMAMATLLSRSEISRDVRQTIYLLCGPLLAIAFAGPFYLLFEKPFLNGIRVRNSKDGQSEQERTATVRDQAIL